jgi:hypothetical protein
MARSQASQSSCPASREIAVGDPDAAVPADAATEAVTPVILVSPAVPAQEPGAVAEMSARALTLIAGGDAGCPGDDVLSLPGRPSRPCQQLAGYACVSLRPSA